MLSIASGDIITVQTETAPSGWVSSTGLIASGANTNAQKSIETRHNGRLICGRRLLHIINVGGLGVALHEMMPPQIQPPQASLLVHQVPTAGVVDGLANQARPFSPLASGTNIPFLQGFHWHS